MRFAMSAWPEAVTVERFLLRVRRRLLALRALEGLAIGLGVATVLAFAGVRSTAILVGLVDVIVAIRLLFGDQWRFGWWRSLPQIAQHLERRTSKARNLLVTASELSGGARGYVHDAVMSRASRLTSELTLAELFPATRVIGATVVAALALTAVLLRP